MARELVTRGHRVIGIELAARLAKAAYDHPEGIDVAVGDLRALPLADHSADLAVASMVLMDLNRLDEAVLEAARVLRNGSGSASRSSTRSTRPGPSPIEMTSRHPS